MGTRRVKNDSSHSVDRGKNIFARKCDEKKRKIPNHHLCLKEGVMRSKFSPNRGLPVRRIRCRPDNRSNASNVNLPL